MTISCCNEGFVLVACRHTHHATDPAMHAHVPTCNVISSNRFEKHLCVAAIAPLAFYHVPDYRVADGSRWTRCHAQTAMQLELHGLCAMWWSV
jgi:hypothetical protein